MAEARSICGSTGRECIYKEAAFQICDAVTVARTIQSDHPQLEVWARREDNIRQLAGKESNCDETFCAIALAAVIHYASMAEHRVL